MEFDDETVINSTTPLNVPLKKSRRPNLSMNSIEPDVGNGSLRTGLGIQGRKQKQPQQEESRKFTRRAKSLSSNFGDGGKVPPPCRSSNSIACNVARSNISTHEHESKDDCKTCRKSFSNEEKLQIELTLPIFLKFEDVRYKIAAKSRRETGKYILHGVTGSVNPGKVLTLMGPSGGGKTTLLNLLSGRENVANHGGRVTYNDQPFTKSLKRRIGFVLQDDVVFPQLTVKETLTYAVLLRLPKTLPKKQKEECAMSVIGVLGLRGGAVVLHIGVLGFLSGVHRNLHVPTSEAMLAKERSVGMYKLSAYFVARNTSDLPLDLILPIAFLLIVYSMVGLKRNVFVFFQSMLTVFLSITAAQDLGLAIGAAFMDLKKATTMASVVVMTFMLAGGFFVQRVPSFMAWIRYLSFNYHTYRL